MFEVSVYASILEESCHFVQAFRRWAVSSAEGNPIGARYNPCRAGSVSCRVQRTGNAVDTVGRTLTECQRLPIERWASAADAC